MARNKEFDTEDVLDKATALFWKKGYRHTSVQDLVDHLGLGKGSLYNAFQDKHSLFLATLDRYAERSKSKLSQVLEEQSPREGFKKLLQGLIEDIIGDHEHRGCFLINATTELAANDPDVARCINANQDSQIDLFTEVLKKAEAQGHLTTGREPRSLALFFSNTMKGLRVMAKMNPRREDMETIALTALTILD